MTIVKIYTLPNQIPGYAPECLLWYYTYQICKHWISSSFLACCSKHDNEQL